MGALLLAAVVAAALAACAAVADPAFDAAAHAEMGRQPGAYTNGEARAFLVVKDGREAGLLWGTYHTAYAAETVMPRAIRERFQQASDLTVEVVMDRLGKARVDGIRRGMVADLTEVDQAAADRLDPATRAVLDGVEVPQAFRGTVSLLGWNLLVGSRAVRRDAAVTPQVGFVDLNLMGFARSRSIPVFGLEQAEAQLAATRIEPNGADAERMLRRTIRTEASAKPFMSWTLSAYGKGDIAGLMAGMSGYMAEPPDLVQQDLYRAPLLTRRNAAWVPQLVRRFAQPGFHFVAFGAGHLVGEDGVVALLRAQGLQVLACPADACPAVAAP